MSDAVHWIVEFDVKDGKLEELKSVMNDMVAATKANEPDISGDEKHLHIYERYVNSAAVLTHMKTFGEKFAVRLLATADATRLVVYGNPNAEAKKVLDCFGARYFGQIGGFTR